MTTSVETLSNLRYLEALYERGYRSAVVDRTLDKIVSTELERTRNTLNEVQIRLHAFEEKYAMSSEEFYRRFEAGELGDDIDFIEWSSFYDLRKSAHEQLQLFDTFATSPQ